MIARAMLERREMRRRVRLNGGRLRGRRAANGMRFGFQRFALGKEGSKQRRGGREKEDPLSFRGRACPGSRWGEIVRVSQAGRTTGRTTADRHAETRTE